MTQEDIKLVFIDLSARIPYHVRVKVWLKDGTTEEGLLDLQHNYADVLLDAFYYNKIVDIKPYLRPMSSLTEKEEIELRKISSQLTFNRRYNLLYVGRADDGGCNLSEMVKIIDYLLSHYLDFRGLIEKDLALVAPEGMYKI